MFMMNSNFSSRMMMGAAIVGIVGAASMYLYEKLIAEKRRAMMAQEISRLDRKMTTICSELESLRELQKESRLRRLKQKKRIRKPQSQEAATPAIGGDVVDAPEISYLSDSEYFTDYQSIADGEMDSDNGEFYDVKTDEEDDTLRETSWNGNHSDLDHDEDSIHKSKVLKSSLNQSS